MIRRFFGFLFHGRLCERCKLERTYVWDPFMANVLCTTCLIVEEINFRAWMEKW